MYSIVEMILYEFEKYELNNFLIENDIFQMNIPMLLSNKRIRKSMIPVVKLKKYGHVLPPDVEISMDRWGVADKISNSMVDSVCLGEKATIY